VPLCSLDLSHNRLLSWRCCEAIALLLHGNMHQAGADGKGQRSCSPMPVLQGPLPHAAQPLQQRAAVCLTKLSLEGVAIGDRGAASLAKLLSTSANSLQVCRPHKTNLLL
jgi:hypothetical protein